MKIEIVSTDRLVEIDGVLVRAWLGRTEGGVECVVYVHRLQVEEGRHDEFAAELNESAAPISVREPAPATPGWWWLSFSDDDGPKGVSVVRGSDLAGACQRAAAVGANPGGEVLGIPIHEALEIPVDYCDRLLTIEQAADLDGEFARQQGRGGKGGVWRVRSDADGSLTVVGEVNEADA